MTLQNNKTYWCWNNHVKHGKKCLYNLNPVISTQIKTLCCVSTLKITQAFQSFPKVFVWLICLIYLLSIVCNFWNNWIWFKIQVHFVHSKISFHKFLLKHLWIISILHLQLYSLLERDCPSCLENQKTGVHTLSLLTSMLPLILNSHWSWTKEF